MPIEIGEDVVPPATPEEDVKFLPSGKILVIVNGKTHTLRRPKMGEFRHFRETLYEEQDTAHRELLERADKLIEEQRLDADDRTPEERRAELREIVDSARRTRAATARQETTYMKWSREVIETLSGRALDVEDDELPFVLSTVEFVTVVQRHWRTVPLPSGAR